MLASKVAVPRLVAVSDAELKPTSGQGDGLTSLANLRDLGGLSVAGGGVTRKGRLYRSDAPHPGDSDPAHLAQWPPALVVDLRMEREAARLPYLVEGAERVLHPLHEDAAPENIRNAEIGALYTYILETAADRVAAAADLVVTRPGPALVHCTVGKDRTGIVIASLLLASGVVEKDVIADYVETDNNINAVVQRITRFHVSSGQPFNPDWLLTPADAMAKVVEALGSEEHGSARAWLVEHGTTEGALDDWVGRFVEA